MKLSFLPSFFKTKEEALIVPDSLLLKKIKSLSQNSNLVVFSHKEIFHHKESYPIALMIYDDLRGIYIFEIKEWSYDDLKNATASKAKSVENSKNTLAFDKTHAIIKKKFNELLHNDGVEIFNYLLMENLSSDEYEHLNDSLQEILPKEKIIFSDSDTSEIFKKLQSAAPEDHTLPPKDVILGTLFVQYAIVKADTVSLCNEEQREFIDRKISRLENLTAAPKSGKSYTLLLKSIKELFKEERKKIILIKPTILSKEILHKRFLELIEHAIIDIDLMAFEILTPVELVNRHLMKLKMPSLEDTLYIDEKLMQKSFNAADLIICDDADIMPSHFLAYLKHIQKRSDLLLVNDSSQEATSTFTQSYLPTEREVHFYQTNPHAKALHLISSLLKSADPADIVVVCSQESREKLQEDLDSFIEDETLLLDASKHLTEQKLDSILLTTYDDIVELEAKHAILMDLCFDDIQRLLYACNIANQTLHILYEEESQEIENLKEKYESNQD
ncbi:MULTISPECIES: hypothetical protein [Sulfurimonas]|uniref:hypothetical protein n=1 Tax=Sulfurimonas TaxID=202746 RepID=UPI0012658FE5|nr:hypothetical protein [Sulfurimonas indica]